MHVDAHGAVVASPFIEIVSARVNRDVSSGYRRHVDPHISFFENVHKRTLAHMLGLHASICIVD